MKNQTPDRSTGQPPRPESSPELPDELRPEKADVRALRNEADLRSAMPSEGSGVSGANAPRGD